MYTQLVPSYQLLQALSQLQTAKLSTEAPCEGEIELPKGTPSAFVFKVQKRSGENLVFVDVGPSSAFAKVEEGLPLISLKFNWCIFLPNFVWQGCSSVQGSCSVLTSGKHHLSTRNSN